MRTHLLLTYDFPPIGGGIARWMAELAKRYPAGSLVVSTGSHPEASDVDATFPNRIDRLPVAPRRLRTIQGLMLWARRTAMLARSTDAEFIWCGNIKPAAYPAKWTRERLGTPFGVILHGGDVLILQHQIHQSAIKRRTARGLLGSAAILVANSEWTRERCLTLLSELELDPSPERVRVVPLGADRDFFRPGLDTRDVRVRYGLDDGRWLLSVARLTRHKGIDTVLRALARLQDRNPDVRYAVVGEGEYQPALEALATELGLGDRVRFLAAVPDRDLPALYNCAEIYLGVSRLLEQRVEGFGISLCEASACGVPIIAGRSGGIPEAVRDGETGILVDAESAEAVANALGGMLQDVALRKRMGSAGRRAVEKYYNWDRVIADLVAIGHEHSATGARKAAS
jgi:phosphatidylinositol alpha-1,6-mannosyltransferase